MTASSPLVHTLRIMDELDAQPRPTPEAVVRQCYEDQGLNLDEGALAQAVKTVEETACHEAPAEVPAQEDRSRFNLGRILLTLLLGSCIVTPLITVGVILSRPTEALSTAQVLRQLRPAVANTTTEEFRAWLKETEAGQAVVKAGQILVVDREGHPEMRWSNVSQEVCHALVEDIWNIPSKRGIAATVDGKSTGFSCQGPSHLIVLTPHL